MRYVLGVDGGGSRVACLVADETGRLYGYGRGGPINTNYVARRQAVESLTGAIRSALQDAGLRGEQIEASYMSAPMEPVAVEEVVRTLGIGRVMRAAEGETPRWAARFWIDGHVGVTVDAGTGSLARGWTPDGRQAGAGGWGATLGDEGSGYWISIQAMMAVLQAHDGRVGATRLTRPVLDHFGFRDVLDMVFQVSHGLVRAASACVQVGVVPDSGSELPTSGKTSEGGLLFRERTSHRGPLTRDEVAGLCPVVGRVARQGDAQAIEILGRAGRELGRLAAAVISRLHMVPEAFVVVPFGGVFKAGELVLGSFRETIAATAPRAQVVLPRFEPVVGAVLLALDNLDVTIGRPILAAIEQSADHFPGCRA
jgi:N-acetylglucosamine kinase-like BadF-type ATPase